MKMCYCVFISALIQLMAAAHAKRDVCYYTFDDVKLRDDLHKIHTFLTSGNILSIGRFILVN